MPKKRTWTAYKHSKAVELWHTDLSTLLIAERLGVTYASLQLHAHRNRNDLPRRTKAKTKKNKIKITRQRYKRYADIKEINKAVKLWEQQAYIKDIYKTLNMSEKTFAKMREYAPARFIERDKQRRIKRDNYTVTEGKFAKVGEGYRLKHMTGYLHMSGKTITIQKVYSWRGTYTQALNMIDACRFELTIIKE
jgi:hypothetical protein